IQGFGNVGENAARILYEKGYNVIAVSDSKGGTIAKEGLIIPEVMKHKNKSGSVVDFKWGRNISNEELLTTKCDILVPAALSEQLNEHNAKDVKAKIILELANAPSTIEADSIFMNKRIMLIPDILANAGGVVVSYFEWTQNLNSDYWEEEKVLEKLKNIMVASFNDVHVLCQEKNCTLRESAYQVAINRILHAERLRGNL
ncbi:MAG TPA: glutamate dehydrogenase, partial [Candidatus Methanoperedens sp.]